MSALEVAAILLAGVWAGTSNTVVGWGTVITFPTLLASLLGGVAVAVLLWVGGSRPTRCARLS